MIRTIAKFTALHFILNTSALLTLLSWGMYTHMETPKESIHRPDIPGYVEGWGYVEEGDR